jgi:2-(1,2-epoxy-1,2-dihydrophenyl)acetyl-CoA isomerase
MAIQVKKEDGVARFTLNRPDAMNALYDDEWAEFADLLGAVEPDPNVRCVLIDAVGPNFSAGGNVKEFASTLDLPSAERAALWMRSGRRASALFLLLHRMAQPCVVSVRGVVAGGGLGLALAADLVVASETTRFMPIQINIGAIPDAGVSYNLVRRIGTSRAMQYALLGDEIDAKTAAALGLANWVVPDADLEKKTEEIVGRISHGPQLATVRTKAAINQASHITAAEHFLQEARDIGACVSEAEFVQRIRAVLKRRKTPKTEP